MEHSAVDGKFIIPNLRIKGVVTYLSRYLHNGKPVVVVDKQDIFWFKIGMNQVEIVED